jgi:hypothetical protein
MVHRLIGCLHVSWLAQSWDECVPGRTNHDEMKDAGTMFSEHTPACHLLQDLLIDPPPLESVALLPTGILSSVLEACTGSAVAPHNNGHPLWQADALFLGDMLKQLRLVQNNQINQEMTNLSTLLECAERVRPTARSAKIVEETAEIARLEQAIASESVALARSRRRLLERQLARQDRVALRWKTLSSILACQVNVQVDESKSCGSGSSVSFPVPSLGLVIILYPNAEGLLDSLEWKADKTILEAAALDVPTAVEDMLHTCLLSKLSNLQSGDLDAAQIAQRLSTFVSRLGCLMDDLGWACRRWEHQVCTETDDEIVLQLHPDSHALPWYLTWQPAAAGTLENLQPAIRVETTRHEISSIHSQATGLRQRLEAAAASVMD